MLHLSREPDDRRAAQRRQVRDRLDRIVDDLRRDVPGHVVLGALIHIARKLNQSLELEQLDGRPARGRVAP